jgi:hypothetical protein
MSELAALQGKAQQGSLWSAPAHSIIIGKDIMELLSNSMYVEPMSIYREYVQNAADAIDDARIGGILQLHEVGNVTITIDVPARTVRIRDNGTGISAHDFVPKLTAFGASAKRGSKARGFRGVGRLAGLGYCQQVIFRTRLLGEPSVSELRWDCRKLKSILRANDFKGDLAELVHGTVSTRTLCDTPAPLHFFEVELQGIIRHKNDSLLDAQAIYGYLSQVAPVPFSPEFKYREEIESKLAAHVPLGNLQIEITGISGPVYRPHRNTFEIRAGAIDEFTQLEFIEVPGDTTDLAVLGWILHHGYLGAIPPRVGVGGLRFRSGNIQVGNASILEEIFPEPRFNAWSVGELHVLDPQLMPNGRRDHFEQNIHFHNVVNRVSPVARTITTRARISSIHRKCLRDIELQKDAAREKLSIIKQGSLAKTERERYAHDIRKCLDLMERLATRSFLTDKEQRTAQTTITRLRDDLQKILSASPVASSLSKLSKGKRGTYQSLFAMIYECAPNENVAKSIVERILRRIR